MQPRRVLVTGVSRFLGGRLATMLAAMPGIEQVIGVDTLPPSAEIVAPNSGVEFVRADIRNPLIAKVIASAQVDTVVHMSVIATPMGAGGRMSMKETNVIGTMQLLAACQKAPSMRKLVVKSTTAIYGSSSRDPALFSEDMEPRSLPRAGYAKDAVEVEGYVRGFGRRRPDVMVSLMRFTNFIGTEVDSPLTRYFQLPVVPTVLGFDPRLQLIHELDGLEVLRRVATEDHPGTFNVGGDGVLLLSQAIRRAGRVSVPVPSPAVSAVGGLFRRAGMVDFSPEQMHFLSHGRVVDTERMRTELGFEPQFSTASAFDDFVEARASKRVITPEMVALGEATAVGLLSRLPGGRRAVDA